MIILDILLLSVSLTVAAKAGIKILKALFQIDFTFNEISI